MNSMNVQIDRTRVSLFSVIGIVAGIAINAFALGIVYSKLDSRLGEVEAFKASRTVETNEKFRALDARLAPFDTALFRLQSVETTVTINDKNLNDRMDRIVDSFGSKIDNLTDLTNGLRTDVKLLAQEVHSDNAKKAALDTLPPEYTNK